MKSKKIVIIGANDFQNPLIEKAKELGYETHVFAWETGAIGEKTADFFYPISIVEKDKILEKCKEIEPSAVVSVGSDLAVLTVNYVARKLGLPCNPEEVDLNATNKYLMRIAFKQADVKTPGFVKVSENFQENEFSELQYPLIVKPTDRSGSRCICKVTNKEQLAEAIKNATQVSFEKCAIIEEMIYGDEYSCECISQNGKHHILAITKKYTTGTPFYIEKAHLEPALFSERELKNIEQEIFKGLDALHIKVGAAHAEFRIDDLGEVRIIEIGSRMGGDCIGTHLVPLSTGYDYIKMVIDVAVGEPLKLSCWNQKKISYIRFIMGNKDLELLDEIKKNYPEVIQNISIANENNFGEITDSSSRWGFFILQTENRETLSKILGESL